MKLPEIKKLLELVNVSSEILLILDREGNIIYSNKSINLLGYTPEEVISKSFSKLVAGHQRLNIEKKLLTSAKKGKKYFIKFSLEQKKLQHFPVKLMEYTMEKTISYLSR